MLRDNIYVSSIIGKSTSGEKLYGSPITVPCDLVEKVEFIPGKPSETLEVRYTLLSEFPLVKGQAVWVNSADVGDRKKSFKVLTTENCKATTYNKTFYRVKIG